MYESGKEELNAAVQTWKAKQGELATKLKGYAFLCLFYTVWLLKKRGRGGKPAESRGKQISAVRATCPGHGKADEHDAAELLCKIYICIINRLAIIGTGRSKRPPLCSRFAHLFHLLNILKKPETKINDLHNELTRSNEILTSVKQEESERFEKLKERHDFLEKLKEALEKNAELSNATIRELNQRLKFLETEQEELKVVLSDKDSQIINLKREMEEQRKEYKEVHLLMTM